MTVESPASGGATWDNDTTHIHPGRTKWGALVDYFRMRPEERTEEDLMEMLPENIGELAVLQKNRVAIGVLSKWIDKEQELVYEVSVCQLGKRDEFVLIQTGEAYEFVVREAGGNVDDIVRDRVIVGMDTGKKLGELILQMQGTEIQNQVWMLVP